MRPVRDPRALRLFEQIFGGDLRSAHAKYRNASIGLDDLRQALFAKLFVGGAEERGKIWDYSGQGPLQGWFRVTVARALLDHTRRDRQAPRALDDERVLGVPAPARDPETEYLRRLYDHEFREAFEQAVRELGPEHRNTLRAYYAEGLTVDQFAAMLGIHRATAARRVSKARDALLAETRRRLALKLSLSRRELESMMQLIQSQLHVSVHRLLR